MQTKKNKELVPVAKQLRKNMTKEERHLWYDFLRSYPLHIDFYCAKAKLVIELDGSQHYDEENMKKDAERTTFLEGYGLKVIRISNREINQNFRGVCEYIDAQIKLHTK